MDGRQIQRHNNYCHHEAGHAVAFWYYGIDLEYVRVDPSSLTYSGEVKPVDHDVESLDQIAVEMQCSAAGNIAQAYFEGREDPTTDDRLIRTFTRSKTRVLDLRESGETPTIAIPDDLRFADLGLDRDEAILEADPDAAVGPETWLPIYRLAEQLIRVELWPAVQAVAYELKMTTTDMHNEVVVALAVQALP
jgi:hypothetical protein